ncbi:MAG: KH domain-containing protein [Microcoleaceae cyanobacterium]
MHQNSLASPDYAKLIRFLIEPFLESLDSLRVDCELAATSKKTWVRLAFEAEDKGRVYGRGGRNIQAIRLVLSAIAELAGESVYLDIYEERNGDEQPDTLSSTRSVPSRRSSQVNSSSPSGRFINRDGSE